MNAPRIEKKRYTIQYTDRVDIQLSIWMPLKVKLYLYWKIGSKYLTVAL